MLSSYNLILLFAFFVTCIACILVILAYLIAPKTRSLQKITSYECGFEPFQEARLKFNVHFYIIAILFLLFDLEVIFIFPWLSSLHIMSSTGFISMFCFIIILTIGFIYEWLKGALNW